jgi:hypothetical protein
LRPGLVTNAIPSAFLFMRYMLFSLCRTLYISQGVQVIYADVMYLFEIWASVFPFSLCLHAELYNQLCVSSSLETLSSSFLEMLDMLVMLFNNAVGLILLKACQRRPLHCCVPFAQQASCIVRLLKPELLLAPSVNGDATVPGERDARTERNLWSRGGVGMPVSAHFKRPYLSFNHERNKVWLI